MRRQHQHPYHIHLHQALTQEDYNRRLEFCRWALQRYEEDEMFFSKILWSDEATFHNNSHVNRHNLHYWSDQNPRWLRQIDHQHVWSLNVWCAIIGDTIIGPFFFDNIVNGRIFLNFLVEELPPLLEDLPLNLRQNMWMQLDGAPCHFSVIVRQHMNVIFPDRWIGRGGPVSWPPRSPDLTCLDYYLWGRIREIVYVNPPTTRENMIERIREACGRISRDELQSVHNGFQRRLQTCIDARGQHFEHLD